MRTVNILITGFNDYNDAPGRTDACANACETNPSCWAVSHPDFYETMRLFLCARGLPDRFEIYVSQKAVVAAWDHESWSDEPVRPDIVISLGRGIFAPDEQQHIWIEQDAINVANGVDMKREARRGVQIDTQYPTGTIVKNPNARVVVHRFQTPSTCSYTVVKKPARAENSFVCNHLHFQGLTSFWAAYFVHLPARPSDDNEQNVFVRNVATVCAALIADSLDYGYGDLRLGTFGVCQPPASRHSVSVSHSRMDATSYASG